jgi:hypothetical protein
MSQFNSSKKNLPKNLKNCWCPKENLCDRENCWYGKHNRCPYSLQWKVCPKKDCPHPHKTPRVCQNGKNCKFLEIMGSQNYDSCHFHHSEEPEEPMWKKPEQPDVNGKSIERLLEEPSREKSPQKKYPRKPQSPFEEQHKLVPKPIQERPQLSEKSLGKIPREEPKFVPEQIQGRPSREQSKLTPSKEQQLSQKEFRKSFGNCLDRDVKPKKQNTERQIDEIDGWVRQPNETRIDHSKKSYREQQQDDISEAWELGRQKANTREQSKQRSHNNNPRTAEKKQKEIVKHSDTPSMEELMELNRVLMVQNRLAMKAADENKRRYDTLNQAVINNDEEYANKVRRDANKQQW